MPVLKYRSFCVISFANVKNSGLLNVYQNSGYSSLTYFSHSVKQSKIRKLDIERSKILNNAEVREELMLD